MFLAALQKKLDVSENYTLSVAKFDVVEGFFLIRCAFLSSYIQFGFLMSISFSMISYMSEGHYSKILILSSPHSSFKITN